MSLLVYITRKIMYNTDIENNERKSKREEIMKGIERTVRNCYVNLTR